MTVIPAIDIIQGRCVRLSQGDYDRCNVYDPSPDQMVRRYLDHGLTRIHAVDLEGAKAREPRNLAVLSRIASLPGAMVEWSGGVTDDTDLEACLQAGAGAVGVGSLAVRQPEVFARWLQTQGPERMILGADLRDGRVAVAGWIEDGGISAEELIGRFTEYGLSQAIVTDISRDGMLQGPSYDLYRHLADTFPQVVFTISGGISCADDIRRLADMGFSRVIVGKAIYEGRITLKELEHLNTDAC